MDQPAYAAASLYAALNALILVWLTLATARVRRKHMVLIGDGGVARLGRTMRGHANAIENIPVMLVLLGFGAALGAPAIAIHVLGAAFTFGRAVHAWHFTHEQAAQWQRATGFGLSVVTLAAAAIGVLGQAVLLL
ncbi:MAPEG family protein [Aminobacter anthyllidis]|uniref:MAPEG family protein n=1 Tax=Aminobacter anthyllidis TaxID=1035067 RepID=A0A9X1A9B8_9HYPH|nr:MAPEG family protein [Aminobacter anthyllidis]MBT1155503.1 MAPEG family protein [Aminobacter anthyllidis]